MHDVRFDEDFKFPIPQTEDFLTSVPVQQILPGDEHRFAFICVTNINLYIFLPTALGYDTIGCHHHRELIRIDAIDELTIRLTYKNESPYLFIKDESFDVLQVIYDAICDIIPPDHTPQIFTQKPLVCKPRDDLYDCLLKRYKALLQWENIQPSEFLLKCLGRILKQKPRSIDLGILEDLGFEIPIILDAISIQPMISSIIVPNHPNSNIYNILLDYLPHNNTLKKLVFTDPIDDAFVIFFTAIRKFSLSQLESIEFVHCNILPNMIQLIILFLQQHEIEIIFTKCLISQPEINIPNMCNSSNKLLGLHMTSVWFVYSNEFQMALINIQNLSLRGCRIKINKLMEVLSLNNSPIQTLDLSKNSFRDPLPNNFYFPKQLRELFLNDVLWSEPNFEIIFNLACISANNFLLSLANANFLDRTKSFDSFFKNFNPNGDSLESLYWNCNTLHDKLFQYLLRCTKLKLLSLAGCNIKKAIFPSLKRYIESNKSLVILDIHGTPMNHLQKSFANVIDWIKKSKVIRRVDFSFNPLKPKVVGNLAQLIIENLNVRQILISNILIDDYLTFEPIVNALKQREMLIYIKFPEELFKKFKRNGSISDDLINEIRPLFKDPLAPEKQECHEQWQKLIDHNYQEYQQIEEANEPLPSILFSYNDKLLSSSNCSSDNTCESDKSVIMMDLFEIPELENDQFLNDYEHEYTIEKMRISLQTLFR